MADYQQRLNETTGGGPPEEGDFNTARLTAKDTPASVRRAIQAELAEVECADDDLDDEFVEDIDDNDNDQENWTFEAAGDDPNPDADAQEQADRETYVRTIHKLTS